MAGGNTTQRLVSRAHAAGLASMPCIKAEISAAIQQRIVSARLTPADFSRLTGMPRLRYSEFAGGRFSGSLEAMITAAVLLGVKIDISIAKD